MEKVTAMRLHAALSSSFSIHSLAEGSEVISEAEEFHKIKELQEKGDNAYENQNFAEALQNFSDALDIDENNVDALASRAATKIEMENFVEAHEDIDKLLSLNPYHPQGHYLLGITFEQIGKYRQSLMAFLKALHLDYESNHANMLANNVCSMSSHFCLIPATLLDRIPEMDGYSKLSEVGACLYSSKQYQLCVEVLNVAQKLATNQKGITMKIQLTLANAHSALGHVDLAVSFYQDCLSTSQATHDTLYQTKSLVGIASLCLEAGDTYQAIVYYEKLLALEQELKGEEPDNQDLPDYWSKELQGALHLNLSIAYKTISKMKKALYHATRYSRLLSGHNMRELVGHSHHNVGMLHEILGNHKEALEAYQTYCSLSKRKGDKKCVAQAYGCLGSVYASLGNRAMSVSYHEQFVAVAKKLADLKLQIQAHEQMGDTFTKIKEYNNAVESYKKMHELCTRNDLHTQTTSLLKIGNAYKAQGKYQYAHYYIEQAKILAQENHFTSIEVICKLTVASILQHSTQMFELDQAKKYFEELIPQLEAKIEQHREEDSFCSEELYNQLLECFDSMQNVLAKLGKYKECLIYAEHSRLNTLAFNGNQNKKQLKSSQELTQGSLDEILNIVHQQNATILYYTVLNHALLLWILQPGVGIARFYAGKNNTEEQTVPQQIEELIDEMTERQTLGKEDYENRSLPLKNAEVELLKRKNKTLSRNRTKEEEYKNTEGKLTDKSLERQLSTVKGPQRKLFDMLLAPVDDFLSKLHEHTALVIIPDKVLSRCPFWAAMDWDNKTLSEYFRITILPCLHLLDKASKNEMNQLRIHDDLEFERSQSRLGGIPKLLSARGESGDELHTIVESTPPSRGEDLDLKKTSNPRLMTSGVLRYDDSSITKRESTPRDSHGACMCASSKSKINENVRSNVTQVSKKNRVIGSPATVARMVGAHSFSTLTTRTSTTTDVTSSYNSVPEFRQVSDPYKCTVFGNPALPKCLHFHSSQWKPVRELKQAQSECLQVAEILNTSAIVGAEATKKRFLFEIQQSTVLHIATYACWKEGLLVCAPNSDRYEPLDDPPLKESYIVTTEEVLNCSLVARLVVLSSGYGPYQFDHKDSCLRLASAFIAAGAQNVLTLLWPVPDACLQKFYYHFYYHLHSGLMTTQAIKEACCELARDDRYNRTAYTTAFALVGKDVDVKLKVIMRAQLDQHVDKAEKSVIEEINSNPLNPADAIPTDKTQSLSVIQECLSMLLASKQTNIIAELIQLMDGALKRLHLADHKQRTDVLSESVIASPGGIKLLKLLQFHFQASSNNMADYPFVVFPHWNLYQLLMPVFDSLRALEDILTNLPFAGTVWQLLPTSQENITNLVDVLCITKHSPEIQLKVNDAAIKSLLRDTKIKRLLFAMGFQQIGLLLTFDSTSSNRKLLTSSLQLFISLSTHKSPTLLHKLDVTLLGEPNTNKGVSITDDLDHMKLPSLTPLILPRNQLRMSTPWFSSGENPDEMFEKIKLVTRKENAGKELTDALVRVKSWHESTLSGQAEEKLDEVGRPKTTPLKVKVISGATASFNRIPVNKPVQLSGSQIDQRRDYANYVLQQRLDTVELKHHNYVRKLYFPYIQNT